MASSLVTQVSRDGTAQQYPQKKKPSFFARLFSCCGTGSSSGGGGGGGRYREGEITEYLLGAQAADVAGRKCLVLDLDETLVHSSFKPIPNADFIIPVEIEDQVHQVYVVKRPGVDEFMRRVGELYEVVVFTASLSKYADPVLDLLDKYRVVKSRLFREACVNHKGNYVKDLGKIGRPLRSVIIIDNSPASYMFNPENALPCESWFDDENDTELLDMLPLLEDITRVEDVRTILNQSRTVIR